MNEAGNIQSITINDLTIWVCAILGTLVSLLTLYNAAKLKTGILAVATYFFGAGMLSLIAGFLFLVWPGWGVTELATTIHNLFFIVGFILLGAGSYKIYKMSRV